MSLSDVDLEALNNWFAQMPSGPFNALHTTAGWEVRQIDTDPTNKHHWPYRLCSSIAGQVSACDDAVFSFIAGVINAWPAIYHAARAEGRLSPEPQAVARTGVVHDLKTWPEPFAAVRAGLKPWELRLDDRDFRVGDVLRLREWIPALDAYTGEVEERVVIWKLDGGQFGLPVGYAILSLAALSTPSPEAGREEGREWFWRIVDAEGLADLPSDEESALRLLVARASPPAPEPGYEAEPVAIKTVGWAALASNGNIRFWLRDREPVQEFANLYGCDVVRLVASPVPVEDIAEEIWRRFAPSYEETFAECANRSEYLLAADAILQRLSNQQGGVAIAPQPILTAPKIASVREQTKPFLGWCPDETATNGGDWRVCWWEPQLKGGCWWGDRDLPERPTIWVPLPPAPTQQEGEL